MARRIDAVVRVTGGVHNTQVRRVAIVGPGVAGKSTFARALGDRTGLPVVHLDHHYWKPGWVKSSPEQWRQRQAELFAGERWIADGSYGGTFDDRFTLADTVIVVARPRLACVASAIRRSARGHGKSIQAEDCPERFSFGFYRWIWNYDRDSRPRLDAALKRNGHLSIVELQSRDAMTDFLEHWSSG